MLLVLLTLCAFKYCPSTASVTSVNVSACSNWSNTDNRLLWWLFHRKQNRCDAIFNCVSSLVLLVFVNRRWSDTDCDPFNNPKLNCLGFSFCLFLQLTALSLRNSYINLEQCDYYSNDMLAHCTWNTATKSKEKKIEILKLWTDIGWEMIWQRLVVAGAFRGETHRKHKHTQTQAHRNTRQTTNI